MTPSKEARYAVMLLIDSEWLPDISQQSHVRIATLIDTAFAEHREQVRRLVEACQPTRQLYALGLLAEHGKGTVHGGTHALEARIRMEALDAALAPFLEQEKVTP